MLESSRRGTGPWTNGASSLRSQRGGCHNGPFTYTWNGSMRHWSIESPWSSENAFHR